MRIKFKKGKQRKFLDLVIDRLSCISLRGLLQFGFDIKYSSLKSYYTERRLLPRDFFESLCYLSKINPESLNIKYFEDHWGQIKGGKIGRRKKKI